MTFDDLSLKFKTARPLIILRAKSAPLMLSFYYEVFSEGHTTTFTNTELRNKLEGYLEDLEYEEKDDELDANSLFDDYSVRAAQYIEKWSNAGFLRKYPNDEGEDLHELTADTRKVMKWIDDLEQKDFIGTSSRFKDIFFKLKKIVEESNENVEQRIEELKKKKWEIENEINLLTLGQRVAVSDDTEIKEQFYELNRMARELLSDFSEVEQNFEQIRRDVQRKYSEKDIIKGSILVFALDALDEIEQKDQGKSFKNFWEFLMDDKKQHEFSMMTDQLYELLSDRNIEFNNDRFLKNFKRYLHASGRKVIDSNRKLSEKISRVLAEKNLLERRRSMELIGEIRQLAFQLVESRFKDDDFIEIECDPHINLVDRWELSEGKHELTELLFPEGIGGTESNHADLSSLFDQVAIDKKKLLRRIETMLEGKVQVSLKEVVDRFGLDHGLSELVGYFSIAASNSHHIILENTQEPIIIKDRIIRMPLVLYTQPPK